MPCCHEKYYGFLSTFELYLGRGGESITHTESCRGSVGVLEEITFYFTCSTIFFHGAQEKTKLIKSLMNTSDFEIEMTPRKFIKELL